MLLAAHMHDVCDMQHMHCSCKNHMVFFQIGGYLGDTVDRMQQMPGTGQWYCSSVSWPV